ncbi:MAG: DNA-binding protein [Deltaproteobacteria bacterium]
MRKIVYSLWSMVYGILFLMITIDYGLSTIDCYAQPLVSSVELIEKAKEIDGKEIVYEGEVIGEVMTRGEYSWVNLNDGLNAVGVWMGNDFLSLISFAGGYKYRGDWLQVRGVFNRACRQHGGDMDIHAQDIIKIRSGRAVKHRLVPEKKRIVLILAGVCLCLLIGQLLSRKLKTK